MNQYTREKRVLMICPLDCHHPQKAFGQRDGPDFRTECSNLSRLTKFPITDYTGIIFSLQVAHMALLFYVTGIFPAVSIHLNAP